MLFLVTLFVIPMGLPTLVTTQLELSMVADDHGTIFANSEAPSVIADYTGAPDGSSINFDLSRRVCHLTT